MIWFGNQGGLWGNAMTWFDHATGSVWSQPLETGDRGTAPRPAAGPAAVAAHELGRVARPYPHTVALRARGNRSGFDLQSMVIVVDLEVPRLPTRCRLSGAAA